MEVFFEILLLVFMLYGFFILWITFGHFRIKEFSFEPNVPQHTFTIVVPFRNEKENLPILLSSFSKLNYPNELFEVIFMDDNSNDKYSISTDWFDSSIIPNQRKSGAPKKDAINLAVQNAKFDWIITTDADCEVPENWLSVLDSFIQKNSQAKMVCGMVFTKDKSNFLSRFQLLDFMSLQSVTIGTFGIGKPFMCNGANFAYKKEFFKELNGFLGNEKIASGDDVFLLQKALKNHSKHVFYLKSEDFVVLTNPVLSWKELFFQRVRWASKTKAYKSIFAKLLAVVVLLGNLGFIFSVFGLFLSWSFLWLIGCKLLVDFIVLIQSKKTNPTLFLLSGFIYPFFSFCVGMYVLFNRKYIWKDRVFT